MHFSTTGLVGNVSDWTATHLDTAKLTDRSHIDQEVAKLSRTEANIKVIISVEQVPSPLVVITLRTDPVRVPPDIGSRSCKYLVAAISRS